MAEKNADRIRKAIDLQSEGKVAEAEAVLREILEENPEQPDALHLLGLLEYQKGRGDESVALISGAADLDEKNPQIPANLGKILADLGRWEEAADAFRSAVRLAPDNASLHHQLGETLLRQGSHAEAESCYRRALELQPDHLGASNGLGVALEEQGLTAEAEACYRQALETVGETPEIRYNLGNTLRDQHRADEAIAEYRRAIELSPDFAVAHVHLALALLLKGDYEAGWQEYEWRWRDPNFTSPLPEFQEPAWDGGPIDGRTILLHAEQGFGDTLQFTRYAGVAAAMGGRVLFRCQNALTRLMKTATGVDQVLAAGDAPPAFDCHAPLLSMPWLTGTSLETVPADVPYLAPEPDLAREWVGRFGDAPGLKVGIAWQGTAERRGNPARACPLAAFRPLLENSAVSLFSLQKETAEADRPLPDGLTDLSGELRDFADTAAIMSALDLVVTIDTAVAHLAGALGRPTWVLLSTAADWRWLMERADSPWYPTARLFRQTREREWDDVLARVAADVAGLSPAQG